MVHAINDVVPALATSRARARANVVHREQQSISCHDVRREVHLSPFAYP